MRKEEDYSGDDDFLEDDNIYNEDVREDQLDNDELKPEEAAFLSGYDESDAFSESEM